MTAIDPDDHTVDELTAELDTVDDEDELQAILEAERAGQDRATAREAVHQRLAEIGADGDESDGVEEERRRKANTRRRKRTSVRKRKTMRRKRRMTNRRKRKRQTMNQRKTTASHIPPATRNTSGRSRTATTRTCGCSVRPRAANCSRFRRRCSARAAN